MRNKAPVQDPSGERSRPCEAPTPKMGLHPRNRHRDRYDFDHLTRSCPELVPFVAENAFGAHSIDFADPAAVKALNRALLLNFYGVQSWDVPPGYLCPPIPGRADYLHHLADLLASCNDDVIPVGPSLRALDIGVGANCVFPLIGHREYGWSFLGSDIDPTALSSAARILGANPGMADAIELRLQRLAPQIFQDLLKENENFAVCLCNPPFHASPQEAREGTERKWRNLRRATGACEPLLNFGGQGQELWCPGGEEAFIRRMIEESSKIQSQCFWFTSLVSKSASLPAVRSALKQARVLDSRTIEMAQGQKKSRIIAWTFLTPSQREAWRAQRWRC